MQPWDVSKSVKSKIIQYDITKEAGEPWKKEQWASTQKKQHFQKGAVVVHYVSVTKVKLTTATNHWVYYL